MIQPLWRMMWRLLQKLRIKPPYDPAIPFLGIYPEEIKTEKNTCTPMFIAALFTVARTWTQLINFTFTFHLHVGEGNGNPLQCSCLENPRDGGVWRAAVYGVVQSWT